MNFDTDKETLKHLLNSFPESYVDGENEFWACPRVNTHFSLNDIDLCGLKCRVLEYLSAPAYKGDFYKTKKANQKAYDYHLNGINSFFGMSFSVSDMEIIDNAIGNGNNHELCEEFITGGYNLQMLFKK